MAEMKLMNRQNGVDLSQEGLFELQCLIKANDIYYAAQCEFQHGQFLAFVSGASDLGLYYLKDSTAPIIKRVPWFQSSRKKIACFCFDPQGSWLLVASVDGSLFIVPAKTLVDEFYPVDQKWTTQDITSFLSLNAQNNYGRPSALVWWEGVSFSGQIGILGTEQGEIVFVNLETGQKVGSTKIEGCVANFFICHDTELDTVTLLITNHRKEQWGLILEKPGNKYTYPLSNGALQRSKHNEEVDNDDSKIFPSTRSRLHGLKQLSVEVNEKLVILKQKLAERNRSSSKTCTDNSNGENNSGHVSSDNENSNETGFFFNKQTDIKCNTTPTAIDNNIHIYPQYIKTRRLIHTQYKPSANCLTIHENGMTPHASYTHKVPENCESIVLTNRFFYISEAKHCYVYVVSRALSQILRSEGAEFNRESIIARFSFNKNQEIVKNIFTLSSTRNTGDANLENNEIKTYNLPKDVADLKVDVPPVDTCIVVTNLGIYKIILRGHILSLFMDLILKRRAIKDANKLGKIFGLNVQQLIECAGDIVLCNREFGRAMELYSLAGCRLSKSILKFASVGYTSEFLSRFITYSTTPAVAELSVLNRIHFSNLSVLAFTELTLRTTSTHNKVSYKDYREFFNFLSTNIYYDELFAINIAAQTNMWCVLNYLSTCRGLGSQVLYVIVKTSPVYFKDKTNFGSQNMHYLLCLSDSSLIQSLLNNITIAKIHISIVLEKLTSLRVYILKRLLKLYNPTNPAMRPLLVRLKARQRAASRSSFSSQGDSVDVEEDMMEISTLVEEIIEAFLQVLLALLYKKQPNIKFTSKFVHFTQLSNMEDQMQKRKNISVDFKRRLLSTGFAHTALIRNGEVYTWGNALQGCLGTGPTISRYMLPHTINLSSHLGVELLSVSSGRCHTLAVTNNGIYAWGGNRYGQLGIFEPNQCPHPQLITELADEIIVDAIAGQYHSMALTSDGRLYTWGWGVHGQLGHGDTESTRHPRVVEALLGLNIRHASAGYAHTLVLTADGYVYGFGFNLYGQLGLGHDMKQTSPVRISLLPERVTLIATKYFHNLAISCTNKLYVWGSNLQGVRQQWKARKAKKLQAKLAAYDLEEEDATEEDAGETSKEATNNNRVTAKSSNVLDQADLDSPTADENQSHLWPKLVDTSLVHGKIVQISTGYNHSALLTKDGTIYVWGRNLDGQLGTGHRHDISIPTPLFTQNVLDYVQIDEAGGSLQTRDVICSKKFLKICCGSNFMVAIETGGNVLAWGNNSLGQLGRAPNEPDERNLKDLVLKFRVSNRIMNCIDHLDKLGMAAETTPNEVPGIPSPTISYQSYDVTPLADTVKPLEHIEQNEFGELTLHYSFEQFHGLYRSAKILKKCEELKNYQACAKIELLDRNLVEALIYQFKALKECNPANLEIFMNGMNEECAAQDLKDNETPNNSKLFEEHVERNLVESLIETVKKQKMKMPVSKSLDSFQTIEQELHNFDCQGGSEEMFDDTKSDAASVEMPLEENSLENGNKDDGGSSIYSEDNDAENDSSASESHLKLKKIGEEGAKLSESELLVMRHAVNIVDFYLNEVEEDAYTPIYEISATAINFWLENNFPIEELEKVFQKYLEKIFYSLGLLLFGDGTQGFEKSERNIEVKNIEKVLSTNFSLKVCSMMLEHIDEGKPTGEYVQMLSMSMAKNYGPPLTGYPGTSGNNTPEQMMDGIISTLSAQYNDSRPFIHVKDPDKVSELLNSEEDFMVFTCGHQYSMSAYKSEVVPQMETELLTLQPNPLPATAQLLGSMLNQSHKPETLCPACLTQILKDTAKSVDDR